MKMFSVFLFTSHVCWGLTMDSRTQWNWPLLSYLPLTWQRQTVAFDKKFQGVNTEELSQINVPPALRLSNWNGDSDEPMRSAKERGKRVRGRKVVFVIVCSWWDVLCFPPRQWVAAQLASTSSCSFFFSCCYRAKREKCWAKINDLNPWWCVNSDIISTRQSTHKNTDTRLSFKIQPYCKPSAAFNKGIFKKKNPFEWKSKRKKNGTNLRLCQRIGTSSPHTKHKLRTQHRHSVTRPDVLTCKSVHTVAALQQEWDGCAQEWRRVQPASSSH